MSARVDRGNRAVLTLMGLVLTAGATAGLLLGAGVLGAARSGAPIVPERVRAFAASQPWLWWAVAAAGLLLALLALRWLLAQLSVDRVGRIELTRNARDGMTTLHSGALTDAVQQEVEGIRGVESASAAVVRPGAEHRLVLTVDLADYADVEHVRSRLEGETVAHVRQAVDDPGLPVDIELRPAARTPGRGLR